MKTSPTSTSTSIFLTAHQSLHDIFSIFQNSYRHILVLSHNFLQHYDKAHLVMKMCTSSVTPLNPDRVVVLLVDSGDEGSHTQYQGQGQREEVECQGQCQGHHEYSGVPAYLLSVVGEDQIVRLGGLRAGLTGGQMRRIRELVLG